MLLLLAVGGKGGERIFTPYSALADFTPYSSGLWHFLISDFLISVSSGCLEEDGKKGISFKMGRRGQLNNNLRGTVERG